MEPHRVRQETAYPSLAYGLFGLGRFLPQIPDSYMRVIFMSICGSIRLSLDIAERKQVLVPKQPTVPVLTFEQVAKQWLSERSRLNFWGDNVKGEKRAFRILEIHAYPFIGNKDINQVSADDVFKLRRRMRQPLYETKSNGEEVRYKPLGDEMTFRELLNYLDSIKVVYGRTAEDARLAEVTKRQCMIAKRLKCEGVYDAVPEYVKRK